MFEIQRYSINLSHQKLINFPSKLPIIIKQKIDRQSMGI
jgi:hypothetical protein